MFRGRCAFLLCVAVTLATSGGLDLELFTAREWREASPGVGQGRRARVHRHWHQQAVPVFSTFACTAGQVAGDQHQAPVFRFVDHPRQPQILDVTPDYFRLFGLGIRGGQ